MKKKLIIMSIVTALLSVPSFAFADSNDASAEKTATYQVNQATNVDEIITRAERGITDLDIGDTVTESTYTIDGQDFNVKTYKTAKLVGNEVNRSFSTLNTKQSNEANIYAVSAAAVYTSSNYESKSDDSYSVTTYSTIYILKENIDEGVYASLTRVTGGWKINDYTTPVSIGFKRYRMGQNGVNRNGSTFDQNVKAIAITNPGPNTFDQNVNYGWQPVALGQKDFLKALVGVTTEADITVHGKSSKLVLSNTYNY
ncbi:hypothetical protein [Paenibacillus sp. MZ03-122A]|uniref:hypothetical protein n=1 Tax=Paenibacillus sp. MZ03-122A TaxID=2962033 RepID=UPI0020B6BB64|nr:hypothetical protein [Paenibacillus sp. MZ03-122A]MCP3778834.1 hypothetical protein [Paenibacillus sp. MZ03-122A]